MDGCLCFVVNVSQVIFAKDEHDVVCQGHVSRKSACDAEPKWLSSAFAHTRMAGMSLIATGVPCMYVCTCCTNAHQPMLAGGYQLVACSFLP